MCWPYGEKATDMTKPGCSVKEAAVVFPVTAFHTRIPSCEHETMCRPSGENATDLTHLVCPVKGPATIPPVMASHTPIV
jgi:hypothetical protein